MSQVQNSYLTKQTIAPPIAFVGLALLAGRFLKYFPQTSQADLLIAAGAASVTSAIYDCAVHDPDHHVFITILGKAAAIAVATIGTALSAKALNGRVDLSFRSLARFGAIECVAAAIIAYATQETPLQRQHRHYSTHQKEWRALEKDARTDLVKQFYEADLPAISLFDAGINDPGFLPEMQEDCFKNLDRYSGPQLSWYKEVLQVWGASPQDYEEYFIFMERCHQTGVEMPPLSLEIDIGYYDEDIETHPVLVFLRGKPSYVEMLYKEFQQTPIYRFHCEMAHHGPKIDFNPLFTGKVFTGKAPLPTLEQTMQQLDAAQVETMDPTLLQMWHQVLQRLDQEEQLALLSEPVQAAFVQRFMEYQSFDFIPFPSPGDLSWINALSQDDIPRFSPLQRNWIHMLIDENPDFVIEFDIAHALNTHLKMRIPYLLTHDVVSRAQRDEVVLANIINQFSRYRNRDRDYRFSTLPFADQRALKDLCRDDEDCILPPYQLSPELVAAALEGDVALLADLKAQFNDGHEEDSFSALSLADQKAFKDLFIGDEKIYGRLPRYKFQADTVSTLQGSPTIIAELQGQFKRDWDDQLNFRAVDLSGYSELSPGDQETVRGLLAPDVAMPYYLTPELVERAKETPELAPTLIEQFRVGGGRDFGFFQLPAAIQEDFRAQVFGSERNAPYLPYRVTPELMANPEMHEKIKQQYQRLQHDNIRNPFGMDDLTLKGTLQLYLIVGHEYVNFNITDEVIAEAGRDIAFKDLLIQGFQDEVLSARDCTDLSKDKLDTLHVLFGDQASLLPLYYSADLITQAEENEPIQAQLIRQFQVVPIRQYDNAFGFHSCSVKERIQLLLCLGEESYDYIDFSISTDIVDEAERDDASKVLLIQGFREGALSARNCTNLSQDQLNRMHGLFGDQANLLPLWVTDALVVRAQDEPALAAQLLKQSQEIKRYVSDYLGIRHLSVKNLLTLRSLFNEHYNLISFQITEQVIGAAEVDEATKNLLILEFQNETLGGYGTFPYNFLDPLKQRLTALFGDQKDLIPQRYRWEALA